ncbi:hypothetical protein FRC08_007595 [Ceratobasidium sp. 394]|nr:hypothetical protein FRC08_007595 [Ceratobasidium sp. 394]KAG9093507.1 hypothetical protein FS749_014269 [Ceratobasidium sp. UAMH 11750]
MLSDRQLCEIARIFEAHRINLVEIIVSLVNGPSANHNLNEPAVRLDEQLCDQKNLSSILAACLDNPRTSETVSRLVRNIVTYQYLEELDGASKKAEGYHTNASHLTADKILQFLRAKLADGLKEKCPHLWRLLQLLLNAPVARGMAKRLVDAADYYTELVPETSRQTDMPGDSKIDRPPPIEGEETMGEWILGQGRRSLSDKAKARQIALAEVVSVHTQSLRQLLTIFKRSVSIFSIIMQSCNVQCNGLQTMVSLFAHSTNTSERFLELLAHTGLGIAPSTINNMIDAMSAEALRTLKTQLPGPITAIAYDNLDISFSTEQPTIEYSGNLAHITTGTFIPLQNATKDDMKVGKLLWAKSKLNPNRDRNEPIVEPNHKNLMQLLKPAGGVPAEDPLSIQSRMAWHVQDILLHSDVQTLAPALKEQLKMSLGQPKAKAPILVVKTKQYPAQAMNVSVSTNHGNAVALDKLLDQGGADKTELDEYVIIIHGDLGTGEKLDSLKTGRCIEEDMVNTMQLYFKDEDPSSGRPLDVNTIYHLASLACPRESKTLASSPDHHLRQHATDNTLLALIAEAWRAEVEEEYGVPIAKWSATWQEVVKISYKIVDTYVAGLTFLPSHQADAQSSDMVNDSAKLFARDGLLWKMFKRSARHGDVGSLEDLLPIWVCIWKHVGNLHKYAEYITQFLLNLQIVWPAKLADIVRCNWLVNPTGKLDGFRGADWMVERNNLMHKVNHAGSGSNRTVEHMIKESTLIDIYARSNEVVEENFYLTKATLWHSPPAMGSTLAMQQKHIRDQKLHSHVSGRILSSPPMNSVAGGLGMGTESMEEEGGASFEEEADSEDEEGVETDNDSEGVARTSGGEETDGDP